MHACVPSSYSWWTDYVYTSVMGSRLLLLLLTTPLCGNQYAMCQSECRITTRTTTECNCNERRRCRPCGPSTSHYRHRGHHPFITTVFTILADAAVTPLSPKLPKNVSSETINLAQSNPIQSWHYTCRYWSSFSEAINPINGHICYPQVCVTGLRLLPASITVIWLI